MAAITRQESSLPGYEESILRQEIALEQEREALEEEEVSSKARVLLFFSHGGVCVCLPLHV